MAFPRWPGTAPNAPASPLAVWLSSPWRVRPGALWLAALVHALLITAVAQVLVGHWELAPLRQFWLEGWRAAVNDSWDPMLDAVQLLREQPGVALYRELFFERGVKFQYPLTSLLPLDLLQRLSGLDHAGLARWLNLAGWCSVWAVVVSSLALAAQAVSDVAGRVGGAGRGPVPARGPVLWPLLLVALCFYPLLKAWSLGQIQTFITVLVSGALLAWARGRTALAGVLLGLCCAIKPQWGVLLLWGALRGQWRFVLAAGISLAALVVPAVLLYGLASFFDYLSVLSYIGKHGESFYANQSLNGLLHRWLGNGNNLKWVKDAFPPYHAVVHVLTVLTSATLLGAMLWWRRRRPAGPLDLGLAVLCLTMASPVAWEHHYGILLPLSALMLGHAWARQAAGAPLPRGWWGLLALSLAAVGQNLSFFNALAATPLNPLQSYLFFGAIGYLLLLVWLLRQPPVPAPDGHPVQSPA